MIKNILTVDLEDWFVVENLKGDLKGKSWEKLPSRVVGTTKQLLDLFDRHNAQATFFILGWVAKHFPDLIYLVASRGHEIACHSYHHNRVDTLTPQQFRNDTKKAVTAIFDACGIGPIGYRAPSWSINSKIPWAFEVLSELGFRYDSSIYPVKHDIYGEPGGPTRVFKMDLENGKMLYELPASTVNFMGKNFPVGGGGYLRHSPLWFTERMINKINGEDRPAVVYIHPWELDEDQPRMENLTYFQRYRQYGSIGTLYKKMELLLQKFDFYTAGEYIESLKKKPIGFDR